MLKPYRTNNIINTAGATSGAGIAYPSEHLSLPPDFSGFMLLDL